MPKKRNPTTTCRIFELKRQGLSTKAIAEKLNLNPETVRRYTKTTDYQSLALDLAQTNASKVQDQINMAHEVVVMVLKSRNPDGTPTKQAVDMARVLANTQTSRLLATKATATTKEDTLEDKQTLLNELKQLLEDRGGQGKIEDEFAATIRTAPPTTDRDIDPGLN